MIEGLESILLGSADATKLAVFYRDVVGLKVTGEYEMGDKNSKLVAFDLGHNVSLTVMDHSEVKGKNKTPERIMLNLEVDDVEKEAARMKKAGAKMFSDIHHIEEYGYVATFSDVDGNYFQLVQTHAH